MNRNHCQKGEENTGEMRRELPLLAEGTRGVVGPWERENRLKTGGFAFLKT